MTQPTVTLPVDPRRIYRLTAETPLTVTSLPSPWSSEPVIYIVQGSEVTVVTVPEYLDGRVTLTVTER
jgi:hypothetical protein